MRLYLLSSTIWHALAQGRAGCRNALPPTGKPAGPHAPAPPGAGSVTRLPGRSLAACSPSGPFSPTSVRRLFPRPPGRRLRLEARLLPPACLRPSQARRDPRARPSVRTSRRPGRFPPQQLAPPPVLSERVLLPRPRRRLPYPLRRPHPVWLAVCCASVKRWRQHGLQEGTRLLVGGYCK